MSSKPKDSEPTEEVKTLYSAVFPDWHNDYMWVNPQESMKEVGLEVVEEKETIGGFDPGTSASLVSQDFYIKPITEANQEKRFVSVHVNSNKMWNINLWHKHNGSEVHPIETATEVRVFQNYKYLTNEQRALSLMYAARTAYVPGFLPKIVMEEDLPGHLRKEVMEFFADIYSEQPSIIRTLARIHRQRVLPLLFKKPEDNIIK